MMTQPRLAYSLALLLLTSGCLEVDEGKLSAENEFEGEASTLCVRDVIPAVSLTFDSQVYWVFQNDDASGAVTEKNPDPCQADFTPSVSHVLEKTPSELEYDEDNSDGRRVVLTPISGVVVDGVGWLFYRKTLALSLFDQEMIGTGIARIDGPGEVAERLTPEFYADEPTLSFLYPEQEWGDTAVFKDGLVTVLACSPSGPASRCLAARSDPENLVDPKAWEYWSKGAWGASRQQASVLGDFFPLEVSDEVSLSWNEHIDKWLLVYQGPVSNDVLASTAAWDQLDDWTDSQRFFTGVPDKNLFIHAVAHHADLDQNDGQVLSIRYFSTPEDDEAGLYWVEEKLP